MQGIDEDDGNPAYWLRHGDQIITDERRAKGDIIKVETEPSKVERGGTETRAITWPPDYYIAHRKITAEQYIAARRFYALWASSKHQHHHVQVAYEERHGSTPVYAHGVKMESRFLMNKEYLEASKAVRGLIGRKVLESVVCYDKFAGPQLVRLKESLDQLVTHFKDKRNSLREE